ncbi:MAG: proline dehydrogenase family protein [Chloroflexi bacterium]|nr:proline dehydrogenase family protein [Ktedonobacteraceae bacterium]MBV9021163.1 proline dehydrogenase family protein [Ktedonobacteraceae bacterium]MBV9706572.1 proline dehydrogenase family protein [Chloroflexota bacterium]
MFKETLLLFAQNQQLRDFVTHNPTTRNVSRRFVAGEALNEAVQATRVLNSKSIQATLNLLGENVSDEKQARAATQTYITMLDAIKQADIDANISVKLTALGLDISQPLCEENTRAILQHAQHGPIFVCIDMEESRYTEQTVDITLRMHEQFGHVGTVIQAYLYRSMQDIERLTAQNVRVRLVKGAYKESKAVAFQHKSEVDINYAKLMMPLLVHGNFPAIATHDEAIIDATCTYVSDYGISKSAFEFQMLYGVRRDLQEKLVHQGYNVRVYVPYGSQWYPYLIRRMAERPANLMFVMSNMLRG